MTIKRTLRRALVSGTMASVTSVTALAAVSWIERRSAAQALNATSHWWHGDRAARAREIDAAHTGTGYATHLLATIFWACFFEGWQSRRPSGDRAVRAGRAVAVSALAATVDYTITPHRFTPGWELVVSRGAMAAVYVAMAAGFLLA